MQVELVAVLTAVPEWRQPARHTATHAREGELTAASPGCWWTANKAL